MQTQKQINQRIFNFIHWTNNINLWISVSSHYLQTLSHCMLSSKTGLTRDKNITTKRFRERNLHKNYPLWPVSGQTNGPWQFSGMKYLYHTKGVFIWHFWTSEVHSIFIRYKRWTCVTRVKGRFPLVVRLVSTRQGWNRLPIGQLGERNEKVLLVTDWTVSFARCEFAKYWILNLDFG